MRLAIPAGLELYDERMRNYGGRQAA